jgi:outer membrane receptor for ferric coprogen and ferric-rhodotorulic acid
LKVNLTDNRQRNTQKFGYSFGGVNSVDGTGPAIVGQYNDLASKQLSVEALLTGAVTVFGQRQEITVGANRVSSDGGGIVHYGPLFASSASAPYQPYPGGPRFCFTTSRVNPCPAGTVGPATPPIDVFNFNPYDPLYTEPANPLPNGRDLVNEQIQTGAYVSLRLTAFDRLHLTTGVRWSRYENKISSENLCTVIPNTGVPGPDSCFGRHIGDAYNPSSQDYLQNHIDWPPPANLSFDVTRQLTAYAGFTNIYVSQANELTSDHKPIGPIRGSNLEAGLKWAARGGKLNLSLSGYRIVQKGFAQFDPDFSYEEISPGVFCCYIDDPNFKLESTGLDFEATGEILPGWQIAASYNYSRNQQKGSDFGSNAGKPFTSIQPQNLYKLWTSYDFGAAGHGGWLHGLTVSGGINGQSSAFYAGSVCVNPITPPPPAGSTNTCVTNGPPNIVLFAFTVPGYVVASARIDYQFSPRWSLSLNADNLFDKIYYQTVGTSTRLGNWYGAPRNFAVTIRAKW